MQDINDLKRALEVVKLNNQKKEDSFSLIKKISEEEWLAVGNKSMRKLSKSHIYIRYINKLNKNLVTVYVGKEIADLLDYKKGSRVGVLTTLSSPHLFLIIKNPEAISSYAVSTTSKSDNCHFSFLLKQKLNFPASQSLPVKFDLSQNYELIIDTNQIIK
ncbi:MAG TPA: hypothetical protein VK622_10710 [Puia sp.]|nr:hypothetical protein [Puia sp.]